VCGVFGHGWWKTLVRAQRELVGSLSEDAYGRCVVGAQHSARDLIGSVYAG